MNDTPLMRIGEVARTIGLHETTIRRLERRGLLHPHRDWAGHRRFTAEDIARLRALTSCAHAKDSGGAASWRPPSRKTRS